MATLPDPFVAAARELLGERFDQGGPALEAYSRDLSTLGHLGFADRQAGESLQPFAREPQAVAHVQSVAEIAALTKACVEHEVPLIPFGAGSGVCGGTLAIRGGVMLDLKALQSLEIDQRSLLITVGAGYNLQLLEDRLQREGLTLGHHPSSITCSTIGGAVAARGAGQLSTRYGKIEDMVVALEVVLPCGTPVVTGPRAPRAATGPDWAQVFTGSEGVLGTITSCTLRVHRLPALRLYRSYSFPTLEAALEASRLALQRGVRPAALRLYDPLDTLMVARSKEAPALESEAPISGSWPLSKISLRGLKTALAKVLPDFKETAERALLARPEWVNSLTGKLPGVGCLLILTFEGEPTLARAEEAIFEEVASAQGGVSQGPEPAERWWRNRIAVSFKQSGVYSMGGFVDTMEVATSWSQLMELHEAVRAALSPHALVMAHFSHAYAEGCSIYFTFVALRGDDPQATRERYEACWRDGLAAAVAAGACVSHHHGVGLLKGEALRAAQGDLHSLVFQPFKAALDPRNLLNPGKLGLP